MKTPRDLETMAARDFHAWLDRRLERASRAHVRLARIQEAARSRCRLVAIAVGSALAFGACYGLPIAAELFGAVGGKR